MATWKIKAVCWLLAGLLFGVALAWPRAMPMTVQKAQPVFVGYKVGGYCHALGCQYVDDRQNVVVLTGEQIKQRQPCPYCLEIDPARPQSHHAWRSTIEGKYGRSQAR